MRIPLFACLAFLAACNQSPRSTFSNTDAISADSVRRYLQNGVNAPLQARDYDSVRRFLDRAWPVVQKNGQDSILSYYWRTMGNTFLYSQTPDSALPYFRTALEYAYRVDSNNTFVAGAKTYLSAYFVKTNNLDSAMKYAYAAYDLRAAADTNTKMSTAMQISIVASLMRDWNTEKRYLHESLRWARNPDQFAKIYNNLSTVHERTGNNDSTIYYADMLQRQLALSRDPATKAAYASALGAKLAHQGKFTMALPHLHQALDLSRQINQHRPTHYHGIALIYKDLGNFDKSFLYMDSAILIGKQAGEYGTVVGAYEALRQIQFMAGKHPQSYASTDSMINYIYVADSLNYVEKAKELETRFQVKEKDTEIANLAKINQVTAQVSAQRKVIIVAVTVGALLLIALGLLIFRRRQAALVIRQYGLQQQLLRAMMQPHFVYNALGNLQAYIRRDQKEQAIKYLGDFAKLTEVTLLNARENYVPVSGEIDAISSYLALQADHYEGKFTYQVDAYEDYEVDNILIPPMLMQPFVENAVVHGVTAAAGNGHVHVIITRDDHTVRCVVTDNGKGMNGSDSKGGKPSVSMGLTAERLQLLTKQTGRKASVTVTDRAATGHTGVQVELVIPFIVRRMMENTRLQSANSSS